MAGDYITDDVLKTLMKTRKNFYKRCSINIRLLAELEGHDIITGVQKNELKVDKLTADAKAEIILDTVAEKGVKAFLNLCHVLADDDIGQSHIVTEVWGLDLNKIEAQREKMIRNSQQSATTAARGGPYSQGPVHFVSQQANPSDANAQNIDATKPPPRSHQGKDITDGGRGITHVSRKTGDQINADLENNYRMSERVRGRAIIINNYKFTGQNLSNFDVDGGEMDQALLTSLFENLHFEVDPWVNLKEEELTQKIKEEQGKQNEGKYDAFIIAVVSHGDRGIFYTADGQEIKILQGLAEKFDTVHVPALSNKPKLLFFDACRGIGAFEPRSGSGPADPIEPHRMADFLFYYATFQDHMSFSGGTNASLFIQELTSIFSERCQVEHVLEMITKVTRKVDTEVLSYRDSAEKKIKTVKQLPECSYTLKRLLYFLPGYHDDE